MESGAGIDPSSSTQQSSWSEQVGIEARACQGSDLPGKRSATEVRERRVGGEPRAFVRTSPARGSESRESAMQDEPLVDIRTVAPERHWEQFARAWVALRAYTYLGKRTPKMDAGVERETMPLRHDMRNAAGGIMAAPLCIAAPEPWWLDDACVPAPVTMSYDVLDPARDVRRVEVLREVLSIGRQMGFTRSRIVDADHPSRVIALSSGSGVSLGDVPPGFAPVENPVVELADSPDLPPLTQVFGIERAADGSRRIAKVTPALASPHAALHLGPINIALEAAAMDALEGATGRRDLQVRHWSVLMIKPGFVGPFVARAKVVPGRGGILGVEAAMRDEGAKGRVMATASAVFDCPI
jgi:hypothetical protein